MTHRCVYLQVNMFKVYSFNLAFFFMKVSLLFKIFTLHWHKTKTPAPYFRIIFVINFGREIRFAVIPESEDPKSSLKVCGWREGRLSC